MKRIALIDPLGLVIQIELEGGQFDVAAPFGWVPCSEFETVGMFYVNGEFVEEKIDAD